MRAEPAAAVAARLPWPVPAGDAHVQNLPGRGGGQPRAARAAHHLFTAALGEARAPQMRLQCRELQARQHVRGLAAAAQPRSRAARAHAAACWCWLPRRPGHSVALQRQLGAGADHRRRGRGCWVPRDAAAGRAAARCVRCKQQAACGRTPMPSLPPSLSLIHSHSSRPPILVAPPRPAARRALILRSPACAGRPAAPRQPQRHPAPAGGYPHHRRPGAAGCAHSPAHARACVCLCVRVCVRGLCVHARWCWHACVCKG